MAQKSLRCAEAFIYIAEAVALCQSRPMRLVHSVCSDSRDIPRAIQNPETLQSAPSLEWLTL